MDRSTVNIKKLIADSDFGDIDQLSKRWQRSAETSRLTEEPDHKQNNPSNINSSNINSILLPNKQKQIKNTKEHKDKETKTKIETLTQTDYKKTLDKQREKKTQHGLQFMDQDTQHFKVRLQHLLNVFRTDAVSQFMSMKRSMLEDQKEQVKNDTQKYLRLYQQKHKQLIETRELLNTKSRDCQNLSIRCERMAKNIYEEKLKSQTLKCLSGPFMQFVKYKEYRKLKTKKQAMADSFRNKMLLRKGLIIWRQNHKECSQQKQKKILQNQLEQVTNKYQKEIQMLRQKLLEANLKNDDHERNKHNLQQNLKKAFMKGVCAMNFEAMNALNGQGIPIMDPLLTQECSSQQSMSEDFGVRANQSHIKSEISFGVPSSNNVGNSLNNTLCNTMSNNMSSPEFGSKSVVFYKHAKIQSKDHNWKDAPVVNIQRQSRQFIEEIQPINVVPECISQQQGRVIKVVNGKSSIVNSSIQSGKKMSVGRVASNHKKI